MKLRSAPSVILGILLLFSCFALATTETLQSAFVIQLLHESDYIGGTASGVMKQNKVIRTKEMYREQLLVYSNSDEPLEIDFSENVVLLVDMGGRATGGYSISLADSILTTEKYVKINVVFSICTDVQTLLVTNPYAFYRIPTQKEILIQEEWIEISEVSNC